MLTWNVYVKDATTGKPVEGAVVEAITPGSSAINPPTRYTSGDGGANLYYQGPPLFGVKATLKVDAAGYAPWTTADTPISLGDGQIDTPVSLTPFV